MKPIEIAAQTGILRIEPLAVRNGLAVTPVLLADCKNFDFDHWTITHIPSGCKIIGDVRLTRDDALDILPALAKLADWPRLRYGMSPLLKMRLRPAVQAAVREILSRRRT